MPKIPDIPSGYGCITVSNEIPTWMLSVVYSVLNGREGTEAVNGIFYSDKGDLVLYRKPTAADKKNFSQLEQANEVWITLESPSFD